jgi:hypothetical protein
MLPPFIIDQIRRREEEERRREEQRPRLELPVGAPPRRRTPEPEPEEEREPERGVIILDLGAEA